MFGAVWHKLRNLVDWEDRELFQAIIFKELKNRWNQRHANYRYAELKSGKKFVLQNNTQNQLWTYPSPSATP